MVVDYLGEDVLEFVGVAVDGPLVFRYRVGAFHDYKLNAISPLLLTIQS